MKRDWRKPIAAFAPAPGYPAQPDHTEKATLFDLLGAEPADRRLVDRELCDVARSLGVPVSTSPIRMRIISEWRRSSAIRSRITPRRKGMNIEEVERWLAPVLNYDPASIVAPATAAE